MNTKIIEEKAKLEANFLSNLGLGLITAGAFGSIFSLGSVTAANTWENLTKVLLSVVSIYFGWKFHRDGVRKLDGMAQVETTGSASTMIEAPVLLRVSLQVVPSSDPHAGHPG